MRRALRQLKSDEQRHLEKKEQILHRLHPEYDKNCHVVGRGFYVSISLFK